MPNRRLIITADDFGASLAVNGAVEQAHHHGLLTSASLMVTGAAVDDAVARAREMPGLGVGLHLVLVEGRPALPPEQVPDLVDTAGNFHANMLRAALAMAFLPRVRRQLYAEVEAQFAAFSATGLPLDHVNAHKHFHLHPVIASAMLAAGQRHGMKAARVPIEPRRVLAAIEPNDPPRRDPAAGPWSRLLRRRLRRAGIAVPDQVFGLAWSGRMDARRLRALIDALPAGVSEIYLHPATRDDWPGHAPGYAYREELAALTNPAVIAACDARAKLVRFADLV
ncbi:MAG: hopanoid biosynthesis-associated protein HpnK [Novosphingobium sp.]